MCPKCKGKKVVMADSGFGFQVEARCNGCNGSGKSWDAATCKTCNDAKTIIAQTAGINVEVDCPDCNVTVIA